MFELSKWLISWLEVNDMLSATDKTVFIGRYIDDRELDKTVTKFVINSTSGTVAPVNIRYERYRISAIGYKNPAIVNDSAIEKVADDLNKLLDHIQNTREFPCGYGNVRAITTILGPTYTADDRVVFSLDIELLK